MGKVSEMLIEREGALNMMTSVELARELRNRLDAEFSQISDHHVATRVYALLTELDSYIKEKTS